MKELFAVILVGCLIRMSVYNKRHTEVVKESTISYQTDVLPIFKSRCILCHNSSNPTLNWLDYNMAYQKRNLIKERLINRTMPPGGMPLLDNERQLIIEWVNQGAKK